MNTLTTWRIISSSSNAVHGAVTFVDCSTEFIESLTYAMHNRITIQIPGQRDNWWIADMRVDYGQIDATIFGATNKNYLQGQATVDLDLVYAS